MADVVELGRVRAEGEVAKPLSRLQRRMGRRDGFETAEHVFESEKGLRDAGQGQLGQ